MRCVGSTGTLGWRAGLGLVVLVSGLACGTGGVAGSASARTGDTDPAVAAARAWMDVLATKDAEKLIQITQLPFTFAATEGFAGMNDPKPCDAMIGDTTRLERLIGCLDARSPELVSALGAGGVKLERIDRTMLRTSFVEVLGPDRPGEHLVRAGIERGATYFQLVLLLVPEEGGPRTLVSALALREMFTFR